MKKLSSNHEDSQSLMNIQPKIQLKGEVCLNDQNLQI